MKETRNREDRRMGGVHSRRKGTAGVAAGRSKSRKRAADPVYWFRPLPRLRGGRDSRTRSRMLSDGRERGSDERAEGRSDDDGRREGSDERGETDGREGSRSRSGVYEGLTRSTSRSRTVGRSGTERVSGRR